MNFNIKLNYYFDSNLKCLNREGLYSCSLFFYNWKERFVLLPSNKQPSMGMSSLALQRSALLQIALIRLLPNT